MAEGGKAAESINRSWALESDEVCEQYCQSCCNVGKSIPAQGYCEDCAEFFCATCCRQHSMFNVTKDHKITNSIDKIPTNTVGDDKTTRNTKQEITFTTKCPDHQNEFIKFICRSCDKLGCSACMTTDHRRCNKVFYLLDILDEIKAEDKDVHDLQRNVARIEAELADDRVDIVKYNNAIDTYNTMAMEKMHKERQILKVFLDSLEEKFKAHADIIRSEDKIKVKKAEEELKSVSDLVENIKSDMTVAAEEHVVNKYIVGRKSKETLERAEHELVDIRERIVPRRYTFVPSTQNIQILQSIENLGYLMFTKNKARRTTFNRNIDITHEGDLNKTNPKESKYGPREDTWSRELVAGVQKPKKNKMKVAFSGEKVTRIQRHREQYGTTRECSVKDIVVLSDDKIALTDAFNYCVTVVDLSDRSSPFSLKMPSWPFGITCISDNQVAVTVPVLKEIHILAIKPEKISTVDVIERGKVCSGIVYYRGKFFVSYNHPQTKLEIIDTSGRLLKSFSNDMNVRVALEKPFYLALNPSVGVLCIADVQTHTVTFMDLDLNTKDTYSCKKTVVDLRGIAMDSDGVVYVCSHSQDSVFQIIDNGAKGFKLLEPGDDIKSPLSLAVSKQDDQLYVGLEVGKMLKVFDIHVQ